MVKDRIYRHKSERKKKKKKSDKKKCQINELKTVHVLCISGVRIKN